MHNYLKINVLLLLIGLINIQVQAQNADNTYVRFLNTSAKVVQGKITGREAIHYDYDGEDLICGYILDIAVTKSWKGGDQNFKVFASNSDVLMDGEYEYFLFARKNPKFGMSGRDALDFINCDDGKSTRMDVSRFEFLATRLRQQIFPLISYNGGDKIVDEDTGIVKRGQWMMIVSRIANSALPFTIMRRRLNNGNQHVIEEMNYADFQDEFLK